MAEANTRSRRFLAPILLGLLSCAVLAFGLAVVTGFVEVRWSGSAECQIRRDAVAEHLARDLAGGDEVRYVYRFQGGLPKCWAQIDTAEKTETIGPWSANSFGGDPGVTQVIREADGYFALLGPGKSADDATYRLYTGVIRLPLHVEGKGRQVGGYTGAEHRPGPPKDPREVLPKPPISVETSVKGLTSHEVSEGRVRPGEEVLLLDKWLQPKRGEWTRIRLWVRFYTQQELASGVR